MSPDLIQQAFREVKPVKLFKQHKIISALKVLKGKGHTYRFMANWLRIRGHLMDHNGVRRVLVLAGVVPERKRTKRNVRKNPDRAVRVSPSPE